MDFSGIVPLGSQAALMAAPAPKRAPEVRSVQQSKNSGDASADARERPQQDNTAAAARDIAQLRTRAVQGDLPAGPPPAFEVSLLEMESDLRHVLARAEAARAQVRDAEALRLKADQTERAASAEAKGLEASIASSETAEQDAAQAPKVQTDPALAVGAGADAPGLALAEGAAAPSAAPTPAETEPAA